ncbi:hypothetical protein HS088_TW10G00355 [Tripterygium wilfordii]|uniref:Uncharacterized protein n=1 Tax=Tripterygium wilfordii TaxID=458696 RepID=A0A7J7D505_TRIWF|nr:hypothetical protein HS088_TW10G00355 [Tripterygium wilfordii]
MYTVAFSFSQLHFALLAFSSLRNNTHRETDTGREKEREGIPLALAWSWEIVDNQVRLNEIIV